MKICPKCKQVYDDNSVFCEQCENEDGSGVKLVDAKECPNCGKAIPADSKRCIFCGVNTQNFAKDATNMDIHGNAVRGDLNITSTVHHDETYIDNTVVHNEVTNHSTTNIIHKDETTLTEKCSICGSIIRRIEGYECPKCGKFVCSDCYNTSENLCNRCSPFTNAKRTSPALEKFVKEIAKYNLDTQNGISFVEQYIVPNSKNDIKEFLIYCSAQREADRKTDKEFINVVWNNKCIHLIEQGKQSFTDDENFIKFLNLQNQKAVKFKERREKNIKNKQKQESRKSAANNRKEVLKKTGGIFIYIAALIIGCIPIWWLTGGVSRIRARKNTKIIRGIESSNEKNGMIIPKDAIILQGYFKNYLEVADDAVITFLPYDKNDYQICFTVDLKKTKGFLSLYEQQEAEFKLSHSIDKNAQIEIMDDYLKCSLPGSDSYSNRIQLLDDLKYKKIGDVFTVTIIHTFTSFSPKKELRAVLDNPPKTVVLQSNPSFFYQPDPSKLFGEQYKKNIE